MRARVRTLGLVATVSIAALAASIARGLPIVDQVTTTTDPGTLSLSFAHTVGAGADSFLVVFVHTRGIDAPAVATAATYDGVAMTKFVDRGQAAMGEDGARVVGFTLVAPNAGTHNVVVTFSDAVPTVASAISFFEVNQSMPTAGFYSSDFTTGTSFSSAYSTRSGDLSLEATTASGTSPPTTVGGSQTPQYAVSQAAGATAPLGASSTRPTTIGGGSTSYNRSFTTGGTMSQLVIFSILSAGTSTPTASLTATPTATGTATQTFTRTTTATATATLSASPSVTPTSSATATAVDTATQTATPSGTATATHTATSTATASVTATPTVTGTATATPLRPDGADCSAPPQCASGFCVDGVCCESACEQPNHSCDAPGRAGQCVDTSPAPAPAASHPGLLGGLAALLAIAYLTLRRRA